MSSRTPPLPSFLRRTALVLTLLTLTVPWNAEKLLASSAGPLPLWVCYALAASTLLALTTSILAQKWWPDTDHNQPSQPTRKPTPR